MTQSLRATILGCGSSGGVPRIGNYWGACDPKEPRNRRRRCSLLIEKGEGEKTTSILIDTSPDIRDQLNNARQGAGIRRLDAVLYTHAHADQCHGIDDLRMVAINMRARVQVYADAATLRILTTRFNYCFAAPQDSPYPPILDGHLIIPYEPLVISGAGGDIHFISFLQEHGDMQSLGFRIGDARALPLAYSSDVVGLPERSLKALAGVQCWIVDALRYSTHPTHANVAMALRWLDQLHVPHGVLTNLHVDLDYATLKRELPAHIEPAFDNMVLNFDGS
jgi:phosphoribosyl 1,2-cyclic phosphate phosphodiesterase